MSKRNGGIARDIPLLARLRDRLAGDPLNARRVSSPTAFALAAVQRAESDSHERVDDRLRRAIDSVAAHSDRSAITGSILVARRAGNHDAHSVTSSRNSDSAT